MDEHPGCEHDLAQPGGCPRGAARTALRGDPGASAGRAGDPALALRRGLADERNRGAIGEDGRSRARTAIANNTEAAGIDGGVARSPTREARATLYDRIPFTTFPLTSVSRKSRPAWR